MLSQEAALKYSLLAAFSSAFFLYGIATRYAGTLPLRELAEVIAKDRGDAKTCLIIAATGITDHPLDRLAIACPNDTGAIGGFELAHASSSVSR